MSNTQQYELVAPDGSKIQGTYETIPSLKGIENIRPDPEDGFSFEYDSDRTEVFWDEQKTQQNAEGEALFLDVNGKVWAKSQLIVRKLDVEDSDEEECHIVPDPSHC